MVHVSLDDDVKRGDSSPTIVANGSRNGGLSDVSQAAAYVIMPLRIDDSDHESTIVDFTKLPIQLDDRSRSEIDGYFGSGRLGTHGWTKDRCW